MKIRNNNKHIVGTFVVCLMLAAALSGVVQATGYANEGLITYPAEVKTIVGNLSDYPNTVILDVRKADEYNESHITSAINIYWKDFRHSENGTLLPIEEVTTILGTNGVNESNNVILYGTKGDGYLFWMLEYLGHKNVSIMDGGFDAWNLSYPDDVTNTSEPQRSPTTYNAHPIEMRIAKTSWLLENYDSSDVQVLDTRSEGEYNGTIFKSGDLRSGHIPGALRIDYAELWEDCHDLKSNANLSDLFNYSIVNSEGERVSLDKDKEIVVYCHSGRRSSYMYFALRLMNYTVRNYDESMKIWYNNLSLPIEHVIPLTTADAVTALEIAVGIRPYESRLDVYYDGRVTSLDAFMILQGCG